MPHKKVCLKVFPKKERMSVFYLLFHHLIPDNNFSPVYEPSDVKPLDLAKIIWKCFHGKLKNTVYFCMNLQKL